MCGSEVLPPFLEEVARRGYPIEYEEKKQRFKFGNQGTLQSTKLWHLPSFMYKKVGLLMVQEVPGKCPLLISEDSMHKLDVSLHMGRRTIDVGSAGVYEQPLEYHPRTGHPIVHLMPPDMRGEEGIPIDFVATAEADEADEPEAAKELECMYEANWSDTPRRTAKMPQVDFEETGTAGANTGVLTRSIKEKLQHLTNTFAEAASVERPVRVKKKLKILELFAWTMAMSAGAAERSWQVMEPISTISGWDIRNKSDRDSAMAYLDRANPDLVVAAWPCGADSQMQNLNAKRPGYAEVLAEKQAENKVLHDFAYQVYKRQREAGKEFVGGNLATSKCWKRPAGDKC